LIERLIKEIQDQLDKVLAEADRLRKALAALDPRSSSAQAPKPRAVRSTPAPAAKPRSSASRSKPSSAASSRRSSGSARTAPGATKAAVLGALADGSAKTAGEVASATGLARGTVSTTLSKLARSGEVSKADRGYQLPKAAAATSDSGA
jgi:DNA-binding transcriptional ArsR family regulator